MAVPSAYLPTIVKLVVLPLTGKLTLIVEAVPEDTVLIQNTEPAGIIDAPVYVNSKYGTFPVGFVVQSNHLFVLTLAAGLPPVS